MLYYNVPNSSQVAFNCKITMPKEIEEDIANYGRSVNNFFNLASLLIHPTSAQVARHASVAIRVTDRPSKQAAQTKNIET